MIDMTDKPVKKTGGNLKGAGPGRPKGVPNKLTSSVKEAIEAAFHGVGGAEYLMRQAEENPQAFMTLLGKIIPAQVQAEFTGKNGGPIQTIDATRLSTEVLAQIMAAKDASNSDSR
jgi:hypothetical protein